MENIKAVLLDLDNTIGNRNKYCYNLFKKILMDNIPGIEKQPLIFETMLQELYTWDEAGNTYKYDNFSKFEKKYKIRIKEFDNIQEYWRNNLGKFFELFPESLDTIKYLKTKYKLAIVTNGTSVSQNLKLDNSNIREYFDYIAISEEAGFAKPDVRIYELALQHLNVRPSEAVFVGDTFQLDIKGAIDAGLNAIWVNQDPNRPCSYPVTTIRNISELKQLL